MKNNYVPDPPGDWRPQHRDIIRDANTGERLDLKNLLDALASSLGDSPQDHGLSPRAVRWSLFPFDETDDPNLPVYWRA